VGGGDFWELNKLEGERGIGEIVEMNKVERGKWKERMRWRPGRGKL
jgi:hypothetical protein